MAPNIIGGSVQILVKYLLIFDQLDTTRPFVTHFCVSQKSDLQAEL